MSGADSVRHLIKGLGPGGAERLLLTQVRSDPSPTRHEVAYVVPEKRHLVPEFEAAGVHPVCLGEGVLRWSRGVRRLMVDEPTRIVHVHSPAVAAVTRLVVATVPRSIRPVVVGTEHNRWPRHHRLTRLANRLTIRREAATIAVSADVASTVRGARPGRLTTVEHGVDLEAVRAEADRAGVRDAFGVAGNDVLVVCVANLRREKALDELVEAARLALAEVPELRFFSVGQGPLAADLDRWIRSAGIADRFHPLGYRDDAPRILSAADVFTLSSHHEGLPVAVMEAFALGVPVVATAAGGVPDAVGDAGVITPIGDPVALAAAYVDLARDPARRAALADSATARATHFSARRAVAEINEIYDAVTKAGTDPSARS
ncbi:MAG: glycosyltransferase [Actinomycetota bacterium]